MSERFAIVTGSSAGLGASLYKVLLERGWTVLGLSRRAVEDANPKALHKALDLSQAQAVQDYFQGPFLELQALKQAKTVALINNAAQLGRIGPFGSGPLPELVQLMALNIAVPAWLMGHLALNCQAAKLRLINIGSGASTSAYPGWGAYCVSKAGLLMAGQVLSVEADELEAFKDRDLAVMDYAPGVVDTDMQLAARSASPEQFPRVQRFVELHKNGELVAPLQPATELADILDQDWSGFEKRRYGR